MVQATPSNYQELQQELPSVASTTVSARDDQTVTEPLTFEPSETSTVPAASTALSRSTVPTVQAGSLARSTVKPIHVSPRD